MQDQSHITKTLPSTLAPRVRSGYKNVDFVRFLLCPPFYVMLLLLIVEAALSATTTWLIIKAGQHVAEEEFLITDLLWIVGVQSTAYIIGAVSWVYAERAGFGAFGRYMLRFARDNKKYANLLGNKQIREVTEPFLTNETFHIFFELMFELEADLKLFFGLIFNAIVLGIAIDAGLPVAYAAVFAVLMCIQWFVRKPVARAYANNQRQTNRLTAHTYNAWDNIFTGNRYNFRLWHGEFKVRLRDALAAQIKSIMAREGLSTVSGIIALGMVFGYIVIIASRDVSNTALLIGLAATLPRQIELSHDVHGLVTGWNDLLAVWTRITGACNTMHPEPDADFESRIKFKRVSLTLRNSSGGEPLACDSLPAALAIIKSYPTGRILVRGGNGSGKSTLLAALKTTMGPQAYYWPTADSLAFAFDRPTLNSQPEIIENDEDDLSEEYEEPKSGFSSGERQLKSLQEISEHTNAVVYLLDEWDANLDAKNRSQAESLVEKIASKALVIEISHRDRV
jgi:ABC-type bacteriocin/lantibiotic exporter with double-glycine peptidase domain